MAYDVNNLNPASPDDVIGESSLYNVLYAIRKMPDREHTIGEIDDFYKSIFPKGLHRTAINNLANLLEAQGLVTLARSTSTGEKYVMLTEKGAEFECLPTLGYDGIFERIARKLGPRRAPDR